MNRPPSAIVRRIPLSLVFLRLVMAPLALGIVRSRWPSWLLIGCLMVAFVSDIYDGILARRWGVATPALRRFDSLTDITFYLAILYCAWELDRDAMDRFKWGIVAVLVIDGIGQAASLVRFGATAATHCYASKAWGILLFATFVMMFGFGMPYPLLPITIGLGLVAETESLLIVLTARQYPRDVISIFHAWAGRPPAGLPIEDQ
jgi:CDP-diacylglycerol--glycerol-3-phosphate 3-phosphatidyltransferase